MKSEDLKVGCNCGCLALLFFMAIVVHSIKAFDDVLLFCFGRTVPVELTRTIMNPNSETGYLIDYEGKVGTRTFSGQQYVTTTEFDSYRNGQATAIVRMSTIPNHCLGGRMAVLVKLFHSLRELAKYVLTSGLFLLLTLPFIIIWVLAPAHVKYRKRR